MALLFTGLVVMLSPFIFLIGRRPGVQRQAMQERLRLVSSTFDASSRRRTAAEGSVTRMQEQPGSIFAKLIYRILKWIRFDSLVLRAGAKHSGPEFLALCAVLSGFLGGLAWFLSGMLIIAASSGLLSGCAPLFALRIRANRRLRAIERVLPQVVEMIARALRAGHSLPVALSIVAEQAPDPARQEFVELFRKQKLGLPLRDGLLELLERVPSQDLRVLVVGILVQRETGGNLTVILDRASVVIRERLQLQGEVLVHTAQGRLTGWILCALPVALFLMLHVVNPSYTKVLIEDPLGRKSLYSAMCLLVLGVCMIRKIVNGIEV